MTTGELFILFVPLFTLFTLSLLSKIVCSLCFLLKKTYLLPVGLNSKGFHRNVFWITRATQKEQATTSLRTNLLKVNHAEHKEDFKNDLYPNLTKASSTAVSCQISEKVSVDPEIF